MTSKGIKASHYLISPRPYFYPAVKAEIRIKRPPRGMINLLPENDNSAFKGDNLLFEFLSNNFNKLFRYNMKLDLKTIKPIIMYDLPLEYQKVVDGDCSGI